MDNRKIIYLDDAIKALERNKDNKAKGDIGGFYNKIIQNHIDTLIQLPSARPEKETCKDCKWEDAFGYGECHHCKRRFEDMWEEKDNE